MIKKVLSAFAVCCIYLLAESGQLIAQTLNDGPINLQLRLRDINTTTSVSDAGILGVGFQPDDFRYRVWVRDNADQDGAGWQGGACNQSDFIPPGNSADFNSLLFNYNYPGVTVPQFFDVRVEAWEDDIPADGLLGFCTGGSNCAYDCCNFCCGVVVFGACVGVEEEDDDYCNANPHRTSVNYRLGNPCEWYDHGYLSGGCADYQPRIESYWRYLDGDACGNPIDLGTLNIGASISHFNSTECYNNSWAGSPANDVFYTFNITQPIGVRITLCGNATWNTNLYLLDSGCNQLYFNNNSATCPPQSTILENLCNPGTYVVVVDGNTVIEEGTFTLVIAEDPSVGLNVAMNSTNVSCFGLTDGTATASVTGGTQPYTYLWPGGSTDSTITGLAVGTYTVTVTDAQNCLVTQTANITEPSPISVSATGVNPTCNAGNDGQVQISASMGGTPPYEYSIGGAFQPGLIFNGLTSNTYTVTIQDVNLCQATATVTLTDPQAILVNSTGTPESCAGFNDGTITPNPSNGAAPYQCALGFPPVFAPCGTFSNLPAGNYIVTVRDNDGCEATQNVNISLVPALNISLVSKTDVSCNGRSDGTFTINATGGTPPVRFSINGGLNFRTTTTFDTLTANNYTVLAEDGNGCTNTLNVQVDEPSVLVPSVLFQIPISCNGFSDASIVITASGGTGPYTYSMDSINFFQSGFFTNLAGGTFDFYIIDNNSCPATLTASTIEPDSLFVIVVSSTPASCAGIDNGSLDLDGTGGTPPYKYSINNGPFQTNTTFNNLAPGDYLVGIEDNNGCLGFDSTSVGANVSVNSVVTVTDVLCNGDNTGQIDIAPSGGTAPYDFSIDNIVFQMSSTFTGLAAANYSAIARDANGCVAVEAITITEPAILVASVDSITDATCPNISDGALYITVQGGVTSYTYQWSNSSMNEDLVNVNGGNYNVVITDNNNCTTSLSATIGQPNPAFTDITNIQDVSCTGEFDGFVDVDIAGGIPPFSYLWSNNSTNQDLIDVPAGNYYLTVTDDAGCVVFDTAFVVEPTPIVTSISATAVSCATSEDANIDLTVFGGTPPYDYLWSNFVFTQDQIGVPAGNYTVLITDDNGCEASESVTIDPAPGLEASFVTTDVSCSGDNDGTAEISVTGGTPPYTYLWNNNETTQMITGLVPGIYNVTVTDSISCEGIFSALIEEPDSFILNVSASDVKCFGNNDGVAVPIVSGGVPPYSFLWNTTPPETNAALFNLRAGIYTLTVTDNKQCTVTETITIVEPQPVAVTAFSNGTTCFNGEDGTVTLFAVGGVPPYEYFVSGSVFQSDSVFTGLAAGEYGISVEDANGCDAVNSITIVEPDDFSVILDPFLLISLGASDMIEPVVNSLLPIASYQWTPSTYLDCDTCFMPIAKPIEDITYTLVVTNIDGCISTAQITVLVKDEYELFIPNAFSPNGDGSNEFFQPLDFGAAVEFQMQIFNRWGGMVFQSESIDIGWDGTYKGKKLHPGLFVYNIKGLFLDGLPFDYVGSVALLR